MPTSQQRVLELALLGLKSERQRIEQEIADIQLRFGQTRPGARQRPAPIPNTATAKPDSPNKGRKMTAAQKKKISQAMKARWAAAKGTKSHKQSASA
jgi:hypothetical protein